MTGWRYYLGLTLILITLAGCGTQIKDLQPTSANLPYPDSINNAQSPEQQIEAPYPTKPEGVVEAFLHAIQADASGKTSVVYLSRYLTSEYRNGVPIGSILGIEKLYRACNIQPATSDGVETALVRATLVFDAGNEEHSFELVWEDNARWRITGISVSQTNPGSTPTRSSISGAAE